MSDAPSIHVGFCGGCGHSRLDFAVVCPRCGRELVSAEADPLVGREVGNYRIVSRLGVGGMGTVYAGVEKNIDKKVAIKIVHPHLSRIAELPDLLAEAKAVNAIGDRGIVDVHGFGALPDGRQYLVMELLEGDSLAALLDRQKRLTVEELFLVGDGILAALEGAHAAGFVHRDIKPQNVFVVRPARGEPFVKLLDFGLVQRSREISALAVGTPAYVAPEQAKAGAAVGPAADLYAVGCVLFECATGRMPFGDGDTQTVLDLHASADRPHVRTFRPSLPAALDALIASLMAIEPNQRPASAALARQGLSRALPRRRSRAWWVALAAVLLAAATGVWVSLRPAPRPLVVIPADPMEKAVERTAAEARSALEAERWAEALEKLTVAEKTFPARKAWPALRGELHTRLRSALDAALGRDDFAAAEALAALEPLPDDDVAAAQLARAAFARKNGMVRVAGGWIDAYEHPNRAGARPTVSVDWADAVKLCEEAGKRLCAEDEWERACRGGAGRPFPYGAALVKERCHRKGKVKSGVPSGALSGCVTPEGVHDLSGNVAEWTVSALREGKPQRVIRGGSFGQSDAQLGCGARDYYLPGLGGAKHIGLRCCL
ncbi:MAG: protein kinase [Archangiaceae bacterium]|nr:protein kinase [Archangiaceae bacterium]